MQSRGLVRSEDRSQQRYGSCPRHVIERIHALNLNLTVTVRAGTRYETIQACKSEWPEGSGVSVSTGRSPNAGQHHSFPIHQASGPQIGPALCQLEVPSDLLGTWLDQAGANPKDMQGLMRHSRISTTMDIYVQMVAIRSAKLSRK